MFFFFSALCFLFCPSGTLIHVYLTVWYWSIHRSINALSVFLFYLFSPGFILDKSFWSVFKVTNYLITLLIFLLNPFMFSMYYIFQIYNFYLFFLIVSISLLKLPIHSSILTIFPYLQLNFKLFSVNSYMTSFVVLYFFFGFEFFFFFLLYPEISYKKQMRMEKNAWFYLLEFQVLSSVC